MELEIKVDMDDLEKTLRQAEELGQLALGFQMLSDMTNYVPLKDTFLRTSGHVSADNEHLIWRTPYARVQFYNQFSRYTTAGTGSRWDLVAAGNHMSDWERVWVRGAGL